MKRLSYIILASVLFVTAIGFFVKDAYALEETIDIKGVNYVSLQQMAVKYNYAVQDNGSELSVVGEGINLVVPKLNTKFTLNGIDYIAQSVPQEREGQLWITAIDWASLFNLALSHYDGVSHMEPVDSEPVRQPVIDPSGENTYNISEEWGDRIPEGVMKHGSPTNVVTPHMVAPIYETVHSNPELEDKVQRP